MLLTSMHFLARLAKYRNEKPYSLRFEPHDSEVPKTNVKLERHDDVQIEDIRGREQSFSLPEDNFAIMTLKTSLADHEFADEEKVVQVFLREVADAVKNFTNAKYVQIFEHTIRKRHPEFPIATGGSYQFNQPTATAHIDSTSAWINELIGKMNDEEAAERLLKMRWHCVNIWKPLKGPVRDWPLAICHPKSVDFINDVEPADLVYPRYSIETLQIYRNPLHKWYYLGDQNPEESIIFTQSENSPDAASAVPHSSFPLPASKSTDEPRESIEVRAILFYNDQEQ